MDAAEQLEMLDTQKYSWTAITTATGSSQINCRLCDKATVTLARPRPKVNGAGLEAIKRTYDLQKSNSDAQMAFYFDASLRAIMAIRSVPYSHLTYS